MLKYSDCTLQAERGKNLICIIMNLNETLKKNENRGKIKIGILTILLISHLINTLEYKTYYQSNART